MNNNWSPQGPPGGQNFASQQSQTVSSSRTTHRNGTSRQADQIQPGMAGWNDPLTMMINQAQAQSGTSMNPLLMPSLAPLMGGLNLNGQFPNFGAPPFTNIATAMMAATTPGFSSSSQQTRQYGTHSDPIIAPSAESGGTPEPSPAYLARASLPPNLVPKARPILMVIDLNGTILHRPNRKNPTRFELRPHAQRFITYCISRFWVVIWSSARPENVAAMVAQVLTAQQRAKVIAVWARDRFGLSASDYTSRVQCYKRLTPVWADEKIARSHPGYEAGERWDQGNTVLVDDSFEKARTEPHNLLQIPEFLGLKEEENPEILPQVHDYVNHLAFQADVSAFIRAHPFQMQ